MRPRGDPRRLAAASGALAAGAAEFERVGAWALEGGPGGAGPDAWHGHASTAYRTRCAWLDDGLAAAAGALREAAAALAALSAGLAEAQAIWDHARSLAASAGLALDPDAPGGPPPAAYPALDPRPAISARAAELVAEAADRAAVADRAAARRLSDAGTPAVGGAGMSAVGGAGMSAVGGAAARGAGRGGPGGRHAERTSLPARGMWIADRIGVAVGAGLAALEARAAALGRLARSGEEPAVSLAAVRALAALERSAFTDSLTAFLPLGGPAVTLAANLAGGEHRQPLLRALVHALGESIGADAGQRVGLAICGVEAGATEGAGAFVCPAIAIAATSAGASLGGAAAVRIYDALGPAPDPPVGATPAGPR